jgi:hypothetical protein
MKSRWCDNYDEYNMMINLMMVSCWCMDCIDLTILWWVYIIRGSESCIDKLIGVVHCRVYTWSLCIHSHLITKLSNHEDEGSLDNKPLISKMVPHACRVVSRTLHAYGLIWESYIQVCNDVYMTMWMWYLCTCDCGVELWIMWIDFEIRWWCKDLIYLEFKMWFDMPNCMRILSEILNCWLYDNCCLKSILMFMTFYVEYFSPFFEVLAMSFYWVV